MKKVIIILAAILLVVVGGIITANSILKYDEEDFEQILIEHIQEDIDDLSEEYGWTEVEVDVDFSDLTLTKSRSISNSLNYVEGEIGYIFKVKEIAEKLDAEEYTYELASQIKDAWFGLAKLDAQYYYGYENGTKSTVFLDSEGNEYTATAGITDGFIFIKNGEVVAKEESTPQESNNKPSGSSSSDGNKRCKKCGNWVSNVTANGYCRTCVDIYVNDWYIGLDGNVYVDRGY